MSKENRDPPECSECGELFGSEELLEDHFEVEHPDKTYNGPAVKDESWRDYWKQVQPFLNTSFGIGFVLGVLLTTAIFGGVAAWNEFKEPAPVQVTAVTCDNCSYGQFQNASERLFRVKFNEIDYQSEEGQELVEKYNLQYVPGFIFEKKVEDRKNFTRVRRQLVEINGAYVVVDGEGEAARLYSEGRVLN